MNLVAVLLIGDFGFYWGHRLMHLPWMWRTHVWHHSPQELYWFSGMRTSFMNSLITRSPYFFAASFYKLDPLEVAILIIIVAFINFFIHANIPVHMGILEKIFITPKFHRIHHAADHQYYDSNFGNILVVWDYLFGTAIDPNDHPEDIPVGVRDVEGKNLVKLLIGI